MRRWVLFLTMLGLAFGGLGVAHGARTFVVKKDGSGPGGYTTINAASTLSQAGDVIEIQDSAVYDEPATVNLFGVALKCTVFPQATVKASASSVPVVISIHDGEIRNLRVVGKGGTGTWQMGLWSLGRTDIRDCFFADFAGPAVGLNAMKGYLLTGVCQGTYFINCAGGTITFDSNYDRKIPADKPAATDVGAYLINHCTILTLGQGLVSLTADFPTNGGSITVKNSVLGFFDKTLPFGTGPGKCYQICSIFSSGWYRDTQGNPLPGAHPSLDIQHDYNAYIGIWFLLWNWMDIDYVSSSPVGEHEIAPIDQLVIDPGFYNPVNYDLSLKSNSKLFGRGEGGSTIGVFQGFPIVPQIIVKKDGTGNATSVTEAIAKATYGDLIEIGDSATYDEPAPLTMAGLTLRGAYGQRPTIKCTQASADRLIQEMLDCTLVNLTLEGKAGKQIGLIAGGWTKIQDCTFKGFRQERAAVLSVVPGRPLKGWIRDTYFFDCTLSTISFTGWGNPTAAEAAPYLIDHCTIINDGDMQIWLEAGYPGDGSNITVKNSILGATWQGKFLTSIAMGAEAKPALAIKHFYNCYPSLGHLWQYGDRTDTGTLDPTELQDVDPLFSNPDLGDYSLQAKSPIFQKGEGSSTIGAFQIIIKTGVTADFSDPRL